MAELYDLESRWDDADDFFVAVVGRRPGSRVVDLGCGTGRLAIGLAAAGHDVTGVEPNPAFLAAARAKPGAQPVRWIEGTSSALPSASFDAAIMSGHVAQSFVDDGDWMAVLRDLRRGLVPGGVLAFDSRDPDARGWEAWAGGWSGTFSDGLGFRSGAEVLGIEGEVVTFEVDTVMDDGVRRQGTSEYRFRTQDRLRASVAEAGFRIEAVFGGWHGEPPGPATDELVVVAIA